MSGNRVDFDVYALNPSAARMRAKYEEDDELRGYVLSLQAFDKLLKEGVADGSVVVTENTIETDKTFDL